MNWGNALGNVDLAAEPLTHELLGLLGSDNVGLVRGVVGILGGKIDRRRYPRWDRSLVEQVQFEVHLHHMRAAIRPGDRVLEIGVGPVSGLAQRDGHGSRRGVPEAIEVDHQLVPI